MIAGSFFQLTGARREAVAGRLRSRVEEERDGLGQEQRRQPDAGRGDGRRERGARRRGLRAGDVPRRSDMERDEVEQVHPCGDLRPAGSPFSERAPTPTKTWDADSGGAGTRAPPGRSRPRTSAATFPAGRLRATSGREEGSKAMDGEVVRRRFSSASSWFPRAMLRGFFPLCAPCSLPTRWPARPASTTSRASTSTRPISPAYQRELGGKWRLRRYGEASEVFAEFKAKPEPGKVHKRRTSLSPESCAALPHADEAGWFSKAIRKHSLHPICLISYRRHAFVGAVDGEEIRLTLDRDVCAAARDAVRRAAVSERGRRRAADREPNPGDQVRSTRSQCKLCHVLGELGLLPESFSQVPARRSTKFPPGPR